MLDLCLIIVTYKCLNHIEECKKISHYRYVYSNNNKKHLFTVIPAKTKQCHFVRICGNVTEKCANFMPNVVILWCRLTKKQRKKATKVIQLKNKTIKEEKKVYCPYILVCSDWLLYRQIATFSMPDICRCLPLYCLFFYLCASIFSIFACG